MRDLLPGAGWGIVDATGLPKAAYWYLRRAWAPRGVYVTDEGLDGLAIHVINDAAGALEGVVELELFRHGRDVIATASAAVEVPPRGTISVLADAILDRFTDSTNAYRFGPPKHDVVAVRLRERTSLATIGEDFHFPVGLALPVRHEPPHCAVEWRDDGCVSVAIRADAFLQSVAISAGAWMGDDNHFHLAPGREKRVIFRPSSPQAAFRAELEALNLSESLTLRAAPPG
jgi:beta-mannosidase